MTKLKGWRRRGGLSPLGARQVYDLHAPRTAAASGFVPAAPVPAESGPWSGVGKTRWLCGYCAKGQVLHDRHSGPIAVVQVAN